MKTVNQRLVIARKAAGFDSVKDAAEALNVPYPTYSGHERGEDGFKAESAILYARKFKVTLDWLLTGKGRGPSREYNLAWELYMEMADLDIESLEYIQNAVEFAKRKVA